MRLLYIYILFFVFTSCKKDPHINPYDNDDLNPPNLNDTNYFNNPVSFSAIQNNIFSPYCADNPGCHDGTFEPDFRTIESSYSTLVYQPVIKNNSNSTFQYRVIPGDAEKSVLYARLLANDLGVSTFDPNSQVMPLTADIVYDPQRQHEWHSVKDILISNVKQWIDDGARDIFGNSPMEPNKVPEMRGCIAFAAGQTTPLNREQPRGNIYIPSNVSYVDFWFSVSDDLFESNQLTYNQVKFSEDLFDFDNQEFRSLEVVANPITETGFYSSTQENFYHKYTLDMSNFDSGDLIFIKIYVQDDVNPVTEIPTNGSDYQFIKHFSFTVL